MPDITASASNAIAVVGISFQVMIPGLPPPGPCQDLPCKDHRREVRIVLLKLSELFLCLGAPLTHRDIYWIIIIPHRSPTSVVRRGLRSSSDPLLAERAPSAWQVAIERRRRDPQLSRHLLDRKGGIRQHRLGGG